MAAESEKLRRARGLLDEFEQNLRDGQPIDEDDLDDAFDLLDEISHGSNAREAKVAENLRVTFMRRVEEHARRVLANGSSETQEQLVRCQHLMKDLESRVGDAPDKFREARVLLLEALGARLYAQLAAPPAWSHHEGPFLASEKGKHFHRPDCKWADEIKSHNLRSFSSHEAAVRAGYKPCKYGCKA